MALFNLVVALCYLFTGQGFDKRGLGQATLDRPQSDLSKPWLFAVYREFYYPVIQGFFHDKLIIGILINQV